MPPSDPRRRLPPDFRSLVAAVAIAGGLQDVPPGARPLDAVCAAYAADLPVDGVSMSVLSGTTVRETVGASDAYADMIEDEQYALGIGPCYDAFARGGPVLVPDVRHPEENRWPAFSSALAATPVRAIFAFPLHLGGVVVGAVDAYRQTPGLPDTEEMRDLLRATDLLVLALASAREVGEPVGAGFPPGRGGDSGGSGGPSSGDPEGRAQAYDMPTRAESAAAEAAGERGLTGWEDFLDALPSDRVKVHQATGMVIGQLGGTPEQALARIRAHAFAENRTIVAVATDIVAKRLILPV